MAVISVADRAAHVLGSTRFTSLATPSLGSAETAVWRVALPPGTRPTPHQVTREEVFVVLAGTASVWLAGVDAAAAPGDAIVVPPHTEFALANAGPDELQLLCCMPVGGRAVTAEATFTPPWAE